VFCERLAVTGLSAASATSSARAPVSGCDVIDAYGEAQAVPSAPRLVLRQPGARALRRVDAEERTHVLAACPGDPGPGRENQPLAGGVPHEGIEPRQRALVLAADVRRHARAQREPCIPVAGEQRRPHGPVDVAEPLQARVVRLFACPAEFGREGGTERPAPVCVKAQPHAATAAPGRGIAADEEAPEGHADHREKPRLVAVAAGIARHDGDAAAEGGAGVALLRERAVGGERQQGDDKQIQVGSQRCANV
jgi:hypothetical protein